MFKEILMFLKSGVDPNIGKLVDVVKQYGIGDIEARILSSAFLAWIESYLNGATCPECLTLITPDVRDILTELEKGKIKCPSCGKKVNPIVITPYRLSLTIMNKASIFDTVPDDIKQNLPDRVRQGIKANWDKISKIIQKVKPSDLYTPVLSWMKESRPDLYYTILFYNIPSEDDPVSVTISYLCSTIYEINFYSNLPGKSKLYRGMMEKARKTMSFLVRWYMSACEASPKEAKEVLFGRQKPRLRDVRDAVITLLDSLAVEEFEKLNKLEIGTEESERIVSNLKVSTEGIKWFATEIEEIYIKGSRMLYRLVGVG